jgi:methionyl-tRNA synthetase
MTEAQTFYVTTPIYYVNDSPHIGHAYTTIAADVLARFMRLDRGAENVYFLTGTDEHGQKVDKAARAAGIDPQSFTDDVSKRFRALVKDPTGECSQNLINATNDDFIRTTEPRHKKAAQELWKRIAKGKTPKGRPNIELDTYGGWYSVRDEAYYQEGELIEKDGKKLAPTGAEVEWVEEESYFFRLSDYQEQLIASLSASPKPTAVI